MENIELKISGYTVFIVKCADGSYYSGMCDDLDKRVKEINNRFVSHFKTHPERVPVTVAFHEDHIPFRVAYLKHKYLRSLTKRYRDKIIATGKWPLGKELREFFKKRAN